MSDEKKTDAAKAAPMYNHTCVKPCFRGGVRYAKGHILRSPDKRAPKHFKGYDPKNDPDAPAKKTTKKAAPKKPAAPEEGQLDLGTGSEGTSPESSGTAPAKPDPKKADQAQDGKKA